MDLLKKLIPKGELVPTRQLYGRVGLIALLLTVGTSLVHAWMNSFGLLMAIKMNAIHLGTVMAIVFLYYPATARSPRENPSVLDWVLAGLSLAGMAFILLQYDRILADRLNVIPFDLVMATMTMILLVEASRRAVGLPLTILSVFFVFYAKYGIYFPGLFAHQGFNWRRIIIRMALTDEGIYGVSLMVSSTYVFMFILFGAFLSAT